MDIGTNEDGLYIEYLSDYPKFREVLMEYDTFDCCAARCDQENCTLHQITKMNGARVYHMSFNTIEDAVKFRLTWV